MAKIYITYDPHDYVATFAPDADVVPTVQEIVTDFYSRPPEERWDFDYTFGTFLFIDALRVEIREGRLQLEDVEFRYNGDIIQFDKDGRTPYWPEGFGDQVEKLLEKLI